MKSARLIVLLFFIPITFHAQKTLTGLWTGTLSNDSVTTRKDQSFEIVLTQYKQKVYGYSRATFIVNDTLYYIVKRVKGTIENDVCEVSDDDIISFNFRGKLDKGIKVTHTFHMNKNDSTWSLSGDWTTNKTKKFYAISGKVDLKDEPDMEKSKILPHLEELDLAKEIPFYVEAKKKAADDELRRIAAPTRKDPPAKPVQSKPEPKKSEPVASITQKPAVAEPKKQEPVAVVEEKKTQPTTVISKPEPAKTEPVATVTQKPAVTESKKQEPIAVVEEKKTQPTTVITKPEPAKTEPVSTVIASNTETKKPAPVTTVTQKPVVAEPKKQEPVAAITENKQPITAPVETRPEPKRTEPVATITQKPVVTEPKKQQPVAVVEEKKIQPTTVTARPEPVNTEPVATVTQKPVVTEPKKQEPVAAVTEKKNPPVTIPPSALASGAAVKVNERKTAPPQEVTFVSDSLILSLYDNGEIDGDTVSVLMNGDLILAKQGLKASAIKKTIYMSPGTDEVILVLYAENLGKYAPNTGLLVVYDGEDRYQVRFSADLQQNASVIFRRKKK